MNMRSADITSKGAAAISLSFMTKALSSTLKVLRVKTTILGLFLLATFWVAIAYHTKSQLLLSRNAAIQNNSNLALAFGEYVAQSVGAIDSALLLSRKVMATERSVHINEIFESVSNGADHIIQLALTDRDGILVQTNLGPVEREVNLSDRPHIRFHKETAADVLYVSEPVMGRVSNRWTIQFSRRAHPDEPENSGVLVASLSPDYFARFFSRFDLGEANVILMNGNGTILAQERRTGGDYTGQIHAAKEEIIKAATTGT